MRTDNIRITSKTCTYGPYGGDICKKCHMCPESNQKEKKKEGEKK